jgi:MFS family permease
MKRIDQNRGINDYVQPSCSIIMHRKAVFSKDFILVVIGQIISIFGNQILRYALPLYLLNKTGSPALFGSILAVSFIPMILLFPVGGIIADRLNKRNIMVVLDFSTALLIVLFYLLSGLIDIVPLIAVTIIILFGIQGAYQPAVKASVPVLVEMEHIMKGNSVIDIINSLSQMLGPVIGGILFSVFGLSPILYVSIGCFFASAVLEIFIHIPYEKKQAKGNIFVIGFADIKESFVFMFKGQPLLWQVALVFASGSLFLGSLILIGFPLIITQRLGFAPAAANRLYGYSQGIIACSAVLGGLLAGGLSKKIGPKYSPLFLTGGAAAVFMMGPALQLLKWPMGIYIILTSGGCLFVALSTIIAIQVMTYIQMLTPKDLIGKITACVICLVLCANPLGHFMFGIVFEHIGNYLFIPFYAAGLIMIGIGVLSRPVFSGISHLLKAKPSNT